MKDDGGPAFPQPRDIGNLIFMGMSLRDLFAAMAMQGLCANPDNLLAAKGIAQDSYELADLMLVERTK